MDYDRGRLEHAPNLPPGWADAISASHFAATLGLKQLEGLEERADGYLIEYTNGYGFVPAVLPVAGLLWLLKDFFVPVTSLLGLTLYALLLLGMLGFGLASESPGVWAMGTGGILLNAWLVKMAK